MKKKFKISRKTKLLFLVVVLALVNLYVLEPKVRAATSVSDVKDSIDKVQDKLEDVQAQLNQSQSQLNITNSKINTTKGVIRSTSEEISRKEQEIKDLEEELLLKRSILASYIQNTFYANQEGMEQLFLVQNNFSQVFSSPDQILSLKDKVLMAISEVEEVKASLDGAKSELAEKVEEQKDVLEEHLDTQQEVLADIQDAKTTISQLSAKLDSLRSRYTELLGKSVSTKDVVEAAKFAAGATGMNKSFLLGVLIQESNKGTSTGSCTYKQSNMSSVQSTAFKSICKELDYDYTKQKVSCPPKSYKGTGGAMGVPQFMPTTWQGWKSKIASATGHKTPDPWNLVDGVTAMALKLSADGADSKKRFDEAKSYCVYLAGGNWGHYCFGSASKYKSSYEDVNCWGSSIRNYGEKVLCLKDNYEKYY